ncbi:MAG: hypothetical protein ABIZ05_09320 [Pseudonocardiaceae bacterium]
MNVLESTEGMVTRVRVLTGSDADPVRLAGKVPIAKSDCTYYCPDAATAERCIAALRKSDERLRTRPEEQMLWDWECTYFEAEPGNPHGGGTVVLGVAWFDQAFFEDRCDAWCGAIHTHFYQQIGIPLEAVTVTHWTAFTN